jgi:hypothetical protein
MRVSDSTLSSRGEYSQALFHARKVELIQKTVSEGHPTLLGTMGDPLPYLVPPLPCRSRITELGLRWREDRPEKAALRRIECRCLSQKYSRVPGYFFFLEDRLLVLDVLSEDARCVRLRRARSAASAVRRDSSAAVSCASASRSAA